MRDYVLGFDEAAGFFDEAFYKPWDYLLPFYCIGRGKASLVIAIGCTGGKLRPVVIAEDPNAAYFRTGGTG